MSTMLSNGRVQSDFPCFRETPPNNTTGVRDTVDLPAQVDRSPDLRIHHHHQDILRMAFVANGKLR